MKKKNLRIYKEEFLKLYKEGMSIRAISEKYKVSKNSVKRYIEEDIEIRPKGLTDKEKNKCKEMFLNGYSVYAISNNLSLGYGTVKRYLSKEFGVVTNGSKKYEHLVPKMKELYINGLSASEISNELNVSRQTIMDYLAEAGIKARTYSETSRLYNLNEDIFNVLDDKKAYILGIIFAKGVIDKAPSVSFLTLSIYRESLHLLDIVTEFMFEDSYPKLNLIDNTYTFRVNSQKLTSRLEELGLRSNISKSSTKILHKDIEPFKHSFFEGYLVANTSINKRSLYISGSANMAKIVREYLENDLGIKIASKTNTGIHLENKAEVKKLQNTHKCIKNKILDFINSLSDDEEHSWGSIISTF